MANLTSAEIESIRWANNDENDSEGRPNKAEPNGDQKDSGLIAGTSVSRQNYNYMFDKYHELFEKVRNHFNDLSLAAASTNLDVIYPVGSIYLSVAPTDPATLFGIGSWEAIEDRFLVGKGDTGTFATAGSTGGALSHTHNDTFSVAGHILTEDEMPSHTHGIVIEDPRGNGDNGSEDGGSSFSTVQTDSAGGDQPHTHGLNGGVSSASSLPPYLTVYMWKRTA